MNPTTNLNRRFAVRSLATLALATCVLLSSACGDDPDTDPPGDDSTPPAGSPTSPGTSGSEPEVADGLYFYPPVQGATLALTQTGAQEGGSEVTVETVSSDGEGQTVTVLEVVTSGDSQVDVERTFLTGQDGSLSIAAAGFLASAEGLSVTAAGDDIRIPPITDLEAGDTATGETFVELSGQGGVTMRNDVTYEVSGEGYEAVTVPVGSYDRAYLVTLDLTVDSSLGASATGTIQYWFVPGFARVRQESTIAGTTFVEELATSSATP